jgi:hypothetical protein
LHIGHGSATVPSMTDFPTPPLQNLKTAWDSQKTDAEAAYVNADDDSGTIESVGSYPFPDLAQTEDEIKQILS